MRFVVYESYTGVLDRINMAKNVTFQSSPSANEQKSGINSRCHTQE